MYVTKNTFVPFEVDESGRDWPAGRRVIEVVNSAGSAEAWLAGPSYFTDLDTDAPVGTGCELALLDAVCPELPPSQWEATRSPPPRSATRTTNAKRSLVFKEKNHLVLVA